MEKLVCVEDYEKLAKEILGKNERDFVNSGADDELTLRWNKDAFKRYCICQNNSVFTSQKMEIYALCKILIKKALFLDT